MVENFKERVIDLDWNFRWEFGETPIVRFKNPKTCTSVVYTLCELKKILIRTDRENDFIPVSRAVMQNALDVIKSQMLMKVQGSMAA